MKYEVTFTRNMLQRATVVVDLRQELSLDELNLLEDARSLVREIAYDKAVFRDVKEVAGDSEVRKL